MYNHVGAFAATSDAFAKAFVIGGAAHRFPRLNVGFLECGVTWAVQLLCDLAGRWEKRGGRNIERLDPARIDLAEWNALLDRHGGDRFAEPALRLSMLAQSDNAPPERDDFRQAGIDGVDDIVRMFDRFFFGCEADEATIGWAFAADVNPGGAVLRPVLGSDIGHWDVTDMRDVLGEAYELVADGRLDREQFRQFACDNPIRLHADMNPRFFDGTPVEAHASALLAREEVGR
jgi:hypothetical protein